MRCSVTALTLALGSLVVFAQTGGIPAGSYTLVTSRSQLEIFLRKAGWLGALADNHVIRAGGIQGSAAGEAQSWHGTVMAPTLQLQVVDPGRSARQRHDIWATMEGPEQLNARQYPEIIWHLDALEPRGSARSWLLRGEFSIHGVSRRVAWPTHLAVEHGVVHVWGSAQLQLTDYGIQPIRRALGTIQVKNQFELRWDTFWQPR